MSDADASFVTKAKEYQRAYYLAHREKKIAYQRKYHRENKPSIQVAKRKARIAAGLPVRETPPLGVGLSRSEYNALYHVERRALRFLEQRILLLQTVSGQKKPSCVACGCTNIYVLVVNHKHGGGRKDAARFGSTRGFSDAVVSGKRSSADLDVRCHNCNILYEYERGYRKSLKSAQKIIKAMTEHS